MKRIASSVRFIRQEAIDRDADDVFGPCDQDLGRVNSSPRPSENGVTSQIIQLIDGMDGASARILAGYAIA